MMRRSPILSVFLAGILAAPVIGAETTLIPDQVQDVLMQNCLKCHDAESKKGDVNLDHGSIDWSNREELDIWLMAQDAIEQGLMPPPDKKQPSREDRRAVLAFIDKNLLKNIPIGGTLPRRLNKA